MTTDYKFPDLGEGVTEGEIKKWLVKEGDAVAKDQALAEVETDKAVVEMPSPVAGIVLKMNHKEGDLVKVGEVLVVIGDKGEAVPAAAVAPEAPIVPEPAEGARKPSYSVVGELPTEEVNVSSTGKLTEAKPSVAVQATPAVRKAAKDLGVDIATVKGSGPNGRVTEEDVKKAKETPPAKAETPHMRTAPKFDLYGWVDRVPLRGIRRTTAKHMIESQTRAAQVTSMDQADVTALFALREKVKKEVLEQRKVNVTFMPFIVKAVVMALKSNPSLNASVNEEETEILVKKYYNIGIAVAIDDGLIVPVVKMADQKGIVDLAEEIHNLAELANSRKIDMADLRGGTFTITNYGAFGTTYGTPIINYPEAAILGTGKIVDTPMVIDGKIEARKMLPLSLTFDHRALDGAGAAKFMNDLKKWLENPEALLLL
ncbi:MAG TPA: dihydrolipoamide acetyltransferase family protein [Methanomassiliicoccales archaeon]|jgi:pyruvate dehydrogenase E2 component (dihydrolipoamide acetyltransferase)